MVHALKYMIVYYPEVHINRDTKQIFLIYTQPSWRASTTQLHYQKQEQCGDQPHESHMEGNRWECHGTVVAVRKLSISICCTLRIP
jgi:hypothetical protein